MRGDAVTRSKFIDHVDRCDDGCNYGGKTCPVGQRILDDIVARTVIPVYPRPKAKA